ncbi:hypothetical protein [Robiginitalea aurantiaca]|uniref:Uncharacterized protein n=1 Tax=Robiginitalea aurantiaca TaxID=3056915 RepID=A0ABT7WD55_9FLAO|nr:hypothetical protein [Robiginitalea aurantiaca]MDM9630852.1 hypothetical protein [Robiginitalea aurantiaca]
MVIFITIFIALVVLNVLLLTFSTSLRFTFNRDAVLGQKAENTKKVYNFKSADSDLKKAI